MGRAKARARGMLANGAMTDNKPNFQRVWATASLAAIRASCDWPMRVEGPESRERRLFSSLLAMCRLGIVGSVGPQAHNCVGLRDSARHCECFRLAATTMPSFALSRPCGTPVDRMPDADGELVTEKRLMERR
jgi:hypothetical protein